MLKQIVDLFNENGIKGAYDAEPEDLKIVEYSGKFCVDICR